jgi:hypothetical protein
MFAWPSAIAKPTRWLVGLVFFLFFFFLQFEPADRVSTFAETVWHGMDLFSYDGARYVNVVSRDDISHLFFSPFLHF